MKGILLAGGTGSRLWPLTTSVSKQLIPVYDKPMIYYPLTTLILAGVRSIALITTSESQWQFKKLLGDGSHLGLSIEFFIQDEPRGISDALLVSNSFIAGEQVAMILGDNLFYGPGFGSSLKRVAGSDGATVFGYRVSNPSDYGVVVLDQQGRAVDLVEKPEGFLSNIALPGLYFLDSSAVSRARELKVSARGELEIVDLLRSYLRDELLSVELMPRGSAWLDTGTFDAMAEASEYVRTVQKRQGQIVGSPEEAAWRQGLISDSDLASLADPLRKSGYGKYLFDLLEDKA